MIKDKALKLVNELIAENKALKAALAQPAQQEPVAWLTKNKFSDEVDLDAKNAKETTGWSAAFPVYTAPQQRPWVGLTDDERLEAAGIEGADEWFWKVVEAIETKLKEKNNG
jgi:hypothetical protein